MSMEEGIACGIGLISMGAAIYILEWWYSKNKNKGD